MEMGTLTVSLTLYLQLLLKKSFPHCFSLILTHTDFLRPQCACYSACSSFLLAYSHMCNLILVIITQGSMASYEYCFYKIL